MNMKTAITILSCLLWISFSACKEDDTEKAGRKAPVLTIKNVSSSGVSFTATVSEEAKDGKIYYALTREDDPEPTGQEIVENKVYFSSHANLAGRTSVLLSISQLAFGKTYYLYSVVTLGDAIGNRSAKYEVKVGE